MLYEASLKKGLCRIMSQESESLDMPCRHRTPLHPPRRLWPVVSHRPYDFCKKGCCPGWFRSVFLICGVPIWVRKQGFWCSYLTPLWCSYLSRVPRIRLRLSPFHLWPLSLTQDDTSSWCCCVEVLSKCLRCLSQSASGQCSNSCDPPHVPFAETTTFQGWWCWWWCWWCFDDDDEDDDDGDDDDDYILWIIAGFYDISFTYTNSICECHGIDPFQGEETCILGNLMRCQFPKLIVTTIVGFVGWFFFGSTVTMK